MTTPPEQLRVTDPRRLRLTAWCVGPPLCVFLISMVLINFTSSLDGTIAGAVSWAYVVAVAQFVIAIVAGHVYISRVEVLERGDGTDRGEERMV